MSQPSGPGVGKVAVTPAQALETAGQLYLAGRLDPAEQVCRQIIERRPNLADAYNLLGVVMNAKGDAKQAVQHLEKAVKLNPSAPSFFANLGEIERQRGRLVEAEIALKKAIELDPRSAQAWSNLGIVHFDREEFPEAEEAYRRALAIKPDFPEAHNNLGNALRAQERRSEAMACYQRAVTLRENYAEAYNNMATALRDEEDYESAEHAYRKAIQLKPTYIEALNNLAVLFLIRERPDEALRVLSDALRIDERDVPSLLNAAKAQIKRGALPIAEQAVNFALAVDDKDAEVYAVLAQVRHDLDQHDAALAAIDRAVSLDPDTADHHSFRGVVLKSMGRLDEARDAIRKAIDLDPDHFGAYANLIDLEDFDENGELLERMRALLAKADKPEADKYVPIHFALGKALEDAKDYEGALRHYAIGCRIRRKQLTYDEAETRDFFEAVKATFDAALFASPPWAGNPSETPVFIVGMPRSGSTLVEQILSSHPDVYGAGEIKVLNRTLSSLRDRFPSIPKYPAMVRALEPAHWEQVANAYLEETEREAGGARRITDKLLTNFFFVGFIHVLFPSAKIIHTRRNPVDTCLSAFTKLFKDDMPHSYDLGELGRYYRMYEDLMAHWEKTLPDGVLLTMDYEAVVDDLEGSARGLVAHLGLPWNEACLAFHTSTRPVKTASVVQVRQPVYRTSVERWRRYGAGLNPLLDALGLPTGPASEAAPAARAAPAPRSPKPKAKTASAAEAPASPKTRTAKAGAAGGGAAKSAKPKTAGAGPKARGPAKSPAS